MRIRDVMTKNPLTVDSEALVLDAQKMMQENNIRRLPVVDKGKLVGIVTKHDLLEASPSRATSLSVFELNYLLAKMKVIIGSVTVELMQWKRPGWTPPRAKQ